MGKRKFDFFAIWLGITILGLAIVVFFVIIKYQPDFFRNMELAP